MKRIPRMKRFLVCLFVVALAGAATWFAFSDRTDDREAFLGLETVLSTGTREEMDAVRRKILSAKRIEDIAGYSSPVTSGKTQVIADRVFDAAVTRLETDDDLETANCVFGCLLHFVWRLNCVECGVEIHPSEQEFDLLRKIISRGDQVYGRFPFAVETNETGAISFSLRGRPSARAQASAPLPPGRIEPCEATPALQAKLDAFGLRAGRFRRAGNGRNRPARDLPFLLYRSPAARSPAPLVVYFGGTGERGTDLLLQFRQDAVFRKVCSPDFQRAHPCHLFAPLLPADAAFESGAPESPTPLASFVSEALEAAVRELGPGTVDADRICATGLSAGGSAALALLSAWPGRFSAAVPVAAPAEAEMVPSRKPGRYWFLHNESEFSSPEAKARFEAFREAVESRGGEVRVSTFPAAGHDAWRAAWAEDGVWEWMLSRTASGRAAAARAAAPERTVRAVCTASRPGKDPGSGPERAVDGLEATAYVSAAPMGAGDWIRVEFSAPVAGTFEIATGTAAGTGRIGRGYAETSSDGRLWTRRGSFPGKDGTCRFRTDESVRLLRIVPTPGAPAAVAVREIRAGLP